MNKDEKHLLIWCAKSILLLERTLIKLYDKNPDEFLIKFDNVSLEVKELIKRLKEEVIKNE